MSLLGTPNMPFGQRFNLTYSASLSVIIDTLSLVSRACVMTAPPPPTAPRMQFRDSYPGGRFTLRKSRRLVGNGLQCIPT